MTQTNGTTATTATDQAPTSLALTPREERSLQLRQEISQSSTPRAIVPSNLAEAQAFANAIATSSLVPQALRERGPDILMMVLAGAELEIPPIRSLTLFHVIEGVPKLSAAGIAARVASSPLCEYLEVVEMTAVRCTMRGKRRGRPEITATYTIEEANLAGLVGKTRSGAPNNWMKFPADMCLARCQTRITKMGWPDLTAGLTSAEEAVDIIALGGADPVGGLAGTITAPPPPPSAAANTSSSTPNPTPAAPAASRKSSTASKAAAKAPIDTTATERAPSSASSSPASSSPASTTEAEPSASSSSPATGSQNSTAPAPSEISAPDVTSSSSATESAGSSAVEAAPDDGGGFGDEPEPAAPPAKSIEGFRAALAAATRETIDAIKSEWVPWSLKGQVGHAHAAEMRALFSARRAELGIK